MPNEECPCRCHTVGSAFGPACDIPGGCYANHRDDEEVEQYCRSNCAKPVRRPGWPNADPGMPCARCFDVTESDLHAIISLDERLQVEDPDGFALGWTTSDNLGVRANGREAPVPGNLEALNLRGPAAGERVTERLVPVTRIVRIPPPSVIPAVYDVDGTYGEVGRLLKGETVLNHETWRREFVLDADGQQLWAPDGDQHGADPLPATVWRWVYDVREALQLEGWPEDGSVGAAIRWLGVHYEGALLALPDALGWADAVRATARSLRSVLGDFKPLPQYVPDARCPRCKLADLWRPPDDDCLECHSCDPMTVLRGEQIAEVTGEAVERAKQSA